MSDAKPAPKRHPQNFNPPFPNNCPVRQYTADGISVGRCWHWTGDGLPHVCPTHGDVSTAVQEYLRTGQLTDERTLR